MKQCRLCWEESGDFVSPCSCKGGCEFIHEECILKEVESRRSFQCSVCKSVYPFRYSISKEVRYKCRQIVGCLSLEVFFMFMLKIYPDNEQLKLVILTLYFSTILLLFYLSR
jgi:E3 ubiquitin-protein ligase DOA10